MRKKSFFFETKSLRKWPSQGKHVVVYVSDKSVPSRNNKLSKQLAID